MLEDAVRALDRWHKKVNQPPLMTGMPVSPLTGVTILNTAIDSMKRAARYTEQMKNDDPRYLRIALWLEECAEKIHACVRGDRINTLDGICDSIYVDVGAAYRFNMDVIGAFTEVVRSNDSKEFSGDPRVRDKGPRYSPPNLEQFINGIKMRAM